MWTRFLEFTQQILSLKRNVADNVLALNNLKVHFKKLGITTRNMSQEMKMMQERHKHEIQRLKDIHSSEINRLEEKINQMDINLEKTIRIQVLEAVIKLQTQKLLAEGNSHNADFE